MGVVKIKWRKFQIFLLELDLKSLKNSKNGLAVRRGYTWNDIWSPGWARERARNELKKKERDRNREMENLRQLIKNLKRRGYLEEKREADKKLFCLTSKAQFEICYCKFLKQLEDESVKKWDGLWRIIIFDVPETHRRFRDALRKIIKIGFVPLQQSVWLTPYDVIPYLMPLLDYLHLSRYVDYFEVSKLNNEDKLLARFGFKRNK